VVDPPAVSEADPFELPDWLGTSEVTWTAQSTVRGEHLLTGELSGALIGGTSILPCDLLAADQAFPKPVLDEHWRPLAHQAWTHGQVLLLEYDGRLTVAVPGTEFTADQVLEALSRLAKAVGVEPSRFVAALRL
jgi:hypothetical protein